VNAGFMPMLYRDSWSVHVAEEELTKSSTSGKGCEDTM
jgi:hypothetical protein